MKLVEARRQLLTEPVGPSGVAPSHPLLMGRTEVPVGQVEEEERKKRRKRKGRKGSMKKLQSQPMSLQMPGLGPITSW